MSPSGTRHWERAGLLRPVGTGSQMSSQHAPSLVAQNILNEWSHPHFGSECIYHLMGKIKKMCQHSRPPTCTWSVLKQDDSRKMMKKNCCCCSGSCQKCSFSLLTKCLCYLPAKGPSLGSLNQNSPSRLHLLLEEQGLESCIRPFVDA